MGRPQEQELQRSGNTPLDPDHVAAQAALHPPAPVDEPRPGRVPPDNEPGHRPEQDQDKPDLDAFAEKLGIEHEDASGDDSNGHSPVEAVKVAATTAREMAVSAREVAVPLAHMVQERVSRATRSIAEHRRLVSRVEHLESEVAELRDRLERIER